MHKYVLVTLIVVAAFCSGCEKDNLPKTVPAEGVVTLDGVKMGDVTLIFIAEEGTYNASAVTDQEGVFKLNAFDTKPGAVPGSYKVELSKTIAKPLSEKQGETAVALSYGLPKKYASFMTSGLKYEIGAEGATDIKFELKSK